MIYFHTIIVLLTSGYVLLSTSLGIYMYALAALSALLMLGDIILNRKQVSFFLLGFLFITIMITVLSAFINNGLNTINSVIKMTIILGFSFIYCTNYPIKRSVHTFLDLMYGIVIISLLLYFSINLMDFNVPSLKIVNSNDIIYNFLGFYSYFDGFMQFRNNSIFWEPGIYASFLVASLYLELFYYNNVRKFRIVIFTTALITTLSSAGIVLFFLYIISSVIRSKVSVKEILVFIVGCLIFIGVFYMVLDVINSHGIDPMRSVNKLINPAETESHRMASPFNLLSIFYQNPFFGLGLDGALTEYSSIEKISLTSTSLIYFASFGILSIIYIFPIVIFLYLNRSIIFQVIIVVFVYMLIINKESHLFFISQYLVMFYILSCFISKKLARK